MSDDDIQDIPHGSDEIPNPEFLSDEDLLEIANRDLDEEE